MNENYANVEVYPVTFIRKATKRGRPINPNSVRQRLFWYFDAAHSNAPELTSKGVIAQAALNLGIPRNKVSTYYSMWKKLEAALEERALQIQARIDDGTLPF